ncbi:c-type cytochrome [Chitinophaga polysaccharea]|uniref:c-type cytochrome n=1 Tax=Chitinophaga TaxID=79328 RepID=UPI001454F055|nr:MULTISPECIES: c-type cytochrome [Chitinophaga]NLR60003.1 c-type cytochrome [Chitinophaga polysaccharea]NLU94232.1 c-type cytochrome [Chitinophaga sp. Ak27]
MEARKVQRYKRVLSGALICLLILALLVGIETYLLSVRPLMHLGPAAGVPEPAATPWQPPAANTLPNGEAGITVLYGQALIRETATFFGPNGSIRPLTNGMNCQNCHLQAGTKPFGNNYSTTARSYPKFRARSNSVETLNKRISDCFERSLNGTAPDTNSREIGAIRAYIEWLGTGVSPGEKPTGSGIPKLALLSRAANPEKGAKVYTQQCKTCHGNQGEGVKNPDSVTYVYPPLWGPHSYNDGAGLYRLSTFAGYVKYNMPFGVDYNSTRLTDEEAWDVAAFINSQPRPHKDQSADWKDIKQKPIDFPFGPYADAYSETQHKYGPYTSMQH